MGPAGYNSPRDHAASEDADDSRANSSEPLKTFTLQVSAGTPLGVGDALVALSAEAQPAFDGQVTEAIRIAADEIARVVRNSAATSATQLADSQEHGEPLGAAGDRWPTSESRPGRGGTYTRAKRKRRPTLPACSASLAVHGLLLSALGLVTIAQVEPLVELNLMATGPPLEQADFSDEALRATDQNDAEVEQLVEEVIEGPIDPGSGQFGADLGQPAIGPPTGDEVAMVEAGQSHLMRGGGGLGGPLGDLGTLFGQGGDGGGRAAFGTGLGAAPTAKFFGAQIDGRRIVFVLDNSGSMQGGRLETVNAELLRCVDSLTLKQEFYVIFYSDTVYPLFFPTPVDRFVRPTDRNKKLLAAWLDTVELCTGDAVADALTAAAMIEPDVVFLLSDGRIHGDRKLQFLLSGNGGAFALHTVGVGMGGSVAGRRNLEEIAAASGGEFREAQVPEEMRRVAVKNARPYHVNGPGAVWGRRVRVRR